eukprot:NODE_390_length_9461_cov_0.447768.p1 type:complete len:1212 gc:universal NODE_390_length_9461_cov_0.447768:6751-3116(-)
MILNLITCPDFIKTSESAVSIMSYTRGTVEFIGKTFHLDTSNSISISIPIGHHSLYFNYSRSGTTLKKHVVFLSISYNVNSLSIQTIIPKWCTNLSQIVQVAIDSNFTAVHFTPPQLRGSSNSPYSLKDHLSFHEYTKSDFQRLPQSIKYFVDVVWNHCSPDSKWLTPDCGYSLVNTPILQNAYKVDLAILRVSDKFNNTITSDSMCTLLDFLRVELKYLNLEDGDENEIINNCRNTLFYERLDPNGPKKGIVNKSNPLMQSYFTLVKEIPVLLNGWVWGSTNAEFNHKAYFLRQVIVWGDCVKLNYGSCYNDNTYLYDYMSSYTTQMAGLFSGFRIDNCHSTPIHVAQYLLAKARSINPDLYIFAELFTNSLEMDRKYCKLLGIHSLIREGMQCSNSVQMSDYIYKYSQLMPLGHLPPADDSIDSISFSNSVFYDITHDNQPLVKKQSISSHISHLALTSFSNTPIGSSRGYDEVLLDHYNIVTSAKSYLPLDYTELSKIGLFHLRHKLNHFHSILIDYPEIHVHEQDGVIQITRMNPATHIGYLLVANTGYTPSINNSINIQANHIEPLLCATMTTSSLAEPSPYIYDVDTDLKISDGVNESHIIVNGVGSIISFDIPTGGILIYKINNLSSVLYKQLTTKLQTPHIPMNVIILNILLYRTPSEDMIYNIPTYDIPNYGTLCYGGLQGLLSVYSTDLGFPIYNNWRQGNWYLDWFLDRLNRYYTVLTEFYSKSSVYVSGTELDQFKTLIRFIQNRIEVIVQLPRYLIPKYAMQLFTTIYNAAVDQFISTRPTWVRGSNGFIKSIAMTCVQFYGLTDSTPSIAAGIPHFTVGYMRSWGRDSCISLSGLYTFMGLESISRMELMKIGGLMQFGLIPNLLYPSRWNSRDATWFYLNALVDYINHTGDYSILREQIEMKYLNDMAVVDLVFAMLRSHWEGISFVENAMDDHMTKNGFHIEIKADVKTGLIYGGNADNCGTWMDKMGSFDTNRGKPSTPRYGAAVEINGLLYKVLVNIESYISKGYVDAKDSDLQWIIKWSNLIKEHFDDLYYNSTLEYYKDTVGGKSDDEIRPNVLIALAVAPELFKHYNQAMKTAKILEGPLGMKTLNPGNARYRGYYDNSSTLDAEVGHGFNYHNGPEWTWLKGYYMMALLNVNKDDLDIQPYVDELEKNKYKGLPELTNENGGYCKDSCSTQAWSTATILEYYFRKNTKK